MQGARVAATCHEVCGETGGLIPPPAVGPQAQTQEGG